jgi:hypothetical protein
LSQTFGIFVTNLLEVLSEFPLLCHKFAVFL